LCALRNTARGVEQLNERIAARLRPLLGATASFGASSAAWYAGRPVTVTRNDYTLRLFNGDIGIALPGADGALMVHFADAEKGFRALAPGRLPAHETAFAMTIHKSQGSEFERVLLVLPNQPNRSVTRELLYTGVTRARARVDVAAPAAVLEHAIGTPTKRHSGLLDRMEELGGRR
jgi:exodeoxyribonuclease V alpha subunit